MARREDGISHLSIEAEINELKLIDCTKRNTKLELDKTSYKAYNIDRKRKRGKNNENKNNNGLCV